MIKENVKVKQIILLQAKMPVNEVYNCVFSLIKAFYDSWMAKKEKRKRNINKTPKEYIEF